MRKILILFVLSTLVLAGCASTATQQATEPVLPVTGDESTATTPVEVTEMAATEEPATTVAPVEPAATMEPAVITEATAAVTIETGANGTVTYVMAPDESTVTYEVGETFLNRGNVFNLAVGKTPGVSGDIQVNFDQPQASTLGPMMADISGFVSDSDRRDSAIRDRFLQSSQYPIVTFVMTAVEGLPETIEPGTDYPVTLRGDLTIRDVTKPAVFEASVRWQNDVLTGQAVTTILMSDFGFGPIDILGMLQTEDEAKITVDFVARPQ